MFNGRRLNSWKEVAAYLQRDVRTVQRWEFEGLPVYRGSLYGSDGLGGRMVCVVSTQTEGGWFTGTGIRTPVPWLRTTCPDP
jgi:hypothetical protein